MAYDAALKELSALLGDALTLSKSDLDLHGRSESHFPPTPPDAVAYPTTTEQVSDLLRICARHGCPLELILKDISTVRNDPRRLTEWEKIAKEEAEQCMQ